MDEQLQYSTVANCGREGGGGVALVHKISISSVCWFFTVLEFFIGFECIVSDLLLTTDVFSFFIIELLFLGECYALLRCCLCSVRGHRVSLCKLGRVGTEVHQKFPLVEGRLGCVGDWMHKFH